MDEGNEFEFHRALYISNLTKGVFPWKAAYYYYCLHIDRIDIMSLAAFKESIQLESLQAEDKEDISGPIYIALDKYYSPVMLMSKDNKLLKVL
tara:strand:- start:223 stop:501 length:279 start_codon:yes stop_codon:yes gene_type:complete